MLSALLIAVLVGPPVAPDSAAPVETAVVELVEVVVGILGPGDHWPI